MKEDLESRGAIEFIAYVIAAKAGEDADLMSVDLLSLLSSKDKLLLTMDQVLQMEFNFLKIVGAENLTFDFLTAQSKPPIVQWKEAIKAGTIPDTLSFEKYHVQSASESLEAYRALLEKETNLERKETLSKECQSALEELQQAEEELKMAEIIGETTIRHSKGQVTIS